MPQPYRRRHHGPKPDRRRALELLAASDGCTEALMFANGLTAEAGGRADARRRRNCQG